MPTAHMIYGYLGVGKTTFASHLEARHGAVRFSNDEWMTRLYGQALPSNCLLHISKMSGIYCKAPRPDVSVLESTSCSTLDFGREQSAIPCDHSLPRAARTTDLEGAFLITRNTFEFLKN